MHKNVKNETNRESNSLYLETKKLAENSGIQLEIEPGTSDY